MKKIIVAGAGIGGISAAFSLAAKGFDVTVFEAKAREELGHDWCDTMVIPAFNEAGLEAPPAELFSPHIVASYKNPKETVWVIPNREPFKGVGYIDRKVLARFLVDEAEKNGVKFVFNSPVKSALICGGKVCGIITEQNGEEEKIRADLVIDSAGMDSAVRKSLPEKFGIKREIDADDTLVVYRAYFDNTAGKATVPEFNMYFYHCRNRGLSWVITQESHTDVLISGFGGLSETAIQSELQAFRREYPCIGNTLLRGGTVAKIPLRKALPQIVCDGYAAIGDSAVMIEALSGSGITLSLKAGKILADTVAQIEGEFCVEELWKYQYQYFKQLGNAQLKSSIIKDALSSASADDIDYLFEKKILTEKELAPSANSKYSPSELISKFIWLTMRPKIFALFLKAFKKISAIKKICSAMPEEYSKGVIEAWKAQYEENL